MNVLLLDTSVVSILFNRNHSLRQTCIEAVADHQLVISFMTRAELSLLARGQQLGSVPPLRSRRAYGVVLDTRHAGQPIQTADAWIAASARQWGCPLVTTDFRDYDAIEDLDVVPIR